MPILDIPLSELEADILFVKDKDSPEEEVKEKWQNTFNSRERCQKNAGSYILSYKCLQAAYGYKLVIFLFY